MNLRVFGAWHGDAAIEHRSTEAAVDERDWAETDARGLLLLVAACCLGTVWNHKFMNTCSTVLIVLQEL
jgi:hypothetical protein